MQAGKNWDKTEGILLHPHETQAHSPPHIYIFHQHSSRRTILRTAPVDNHCCNPIKKLVTHQRNRAEHKGVAALSWERCRMWRSIPCLCSFVETEWWKESKTEDSLPKEEGKEFSLYFFWFQEWLCSLASLKMLDKCSISLLTIKGIIYFMVAFSLRRDWNHEEPGRGGQGGILRTWGYFKIISLSV